MHEYCKKADRPWQALATKACVGIDKGVRGKGGGRTNKEKKEKGIYMYTDRKRFSYLRRGI